MRLPSAGQSMRKAYSRSLKTRLRPSERSLGQMRVSRLKPCFRFRPGAEATVSAGRGPGRHEPARPSSAFGDCAGAEKVQEAKRAVPSTAMSCPRIKRITRITAPIKQKIETKLKGGGYC